MTPIFESSRFYLLYSILPHKSDWKVDMISWVILYWSVTACSVFRMQYSTFPNEFDRMVHRILELYFIDQSCTVRSGGRVYSFYSSWSRAVISSNYTWRQQTLHEYDSEDWVYRLVVLLLVSSSRVWRQQREMSIQWFHASNFPIYILLLFEVTILYVD